MIGGKSWTRWILQTANTWEDMKFVIKETGIAMIDHEHKRMMDYIVEINKLLFQLEKNFNVEVFEQQRKMMNSFFRYTAQHCTNEEKFIRKYDIPGFDLQRREHRKLLSVMKEIIYQFETGRVTSAFRHRIKLLQLVVSHINNVDNSVFKFSNITGNIMHMVSWSDIHSFIRLLHIPVLDKQHKVLTEMIISFIQLLEAFGTVPGAESEILDTFESIVDFSKIHFETELDIIEKYEIPGGDIQNEQHDNFVEFLESSYILIKNNPVMALEQMKKRLLLWWIQHINIFDYRTFRKSDWMTAVLLKAEKPDDVSWLIARTGVKEVDHDHFHFLDILFKNLRLFEQGRSLTRQWRVEGLNELLAYAKEHFEREEGIMIKKDVLDREQHILEHKSIIKSLERFSQLNESDRVDLSSAFKRKILAIWISHINDTDTGTFGVSYD